jgi:DNA-binding transcriptional MerR regulator
MRVRSRYGDEDLDRLWRIRVYRELDVPLDEIVGLLDGDTDADDHLRRQHELLVARRDRLDGILRVLERTMEARSMGIRLTPDEMFEVFGDVDPGEHAQEAEERWGETDAWQQSQRRTSQYTKDDWLAIKEEAAGIDRAFVAAMAAGHPGRSDTAMDIAERHRAHVRLRPAEGVVPRLSPRVTLGSGPTVGGTRPRPGVDVRGIEEVAGGDPQERGQGREPALRRVGQTCVEGVSCQEVDVFPFGSVDIEEPWPVRGFRFHNGVQDREGRRWRRWRRRRRTSSWSRGPRRRCLRHASAGAA